MKIIKVINNNVVSSLDENDNEIVVMGRGIGYQKQPGDEVEDSNVDKVFALSGKKKTNQYMELLEKVPYEHIKAANEIIAYAKCSLNKRLNDNIYIALTDHLSFAVDRKEQGIDFKNAFLWEIRRFYNHEYLIGKEALEIIKRRLNVELSEDEAGFIAMHIVNAELDTNMEQSLAMTKIIQDILNIVKYHFNINLDENTLAYERFLTHLKFFVQRAVSNRYYEADDPDFCKLIERQYPQAYACAEKIREYMENKIDYEVTIEEMAYLTVHIKRVMES